MSVTTLAVVSEIWTLVHDHLPEHDVPDLAEGLVGLLLDHNFDLDDIRETFETDGDIMDAVEYFGEYAEDTEAEYDRETEDYYSDEDDEW